MSRPWPEWQGAVINGLYPLRAVLHGAEHSAVFRTEATPRAAEAAIKIVRSEQVLTSLQLRHWRAAAALSHPHLIRLFDSGQCQVGGHHFLYVVTEYADQTLAQILPKRALTPEEVRELLAPTLAALSFLHSKNLVQGQLKPANFLVVGDQLKLSSDGIRLVGEPRSGAASASLYDPPEASHGRFTAAGDMWGLGVTVVEALTQCLPWPDKHSASAGLPPNMPQAFVELAQKCLSHDPAGRPTAAELRAPPKPAAPAPVAAVQTMPREPRAAVQAPPPRTRLPMVPVLLAAGSLLLLVMLWAGVRAYRGHAGSPPPPEPLASAPAPQQSAPPAAVPLAPTAVPARTASGTILSSAKASKSTHPAAHRPEPAAAAPQETSPGIAHAHIPAVPHSALRTIHGRIKVAVLVMVDRSGKVVDAALENPGPSSYFARKARDAAREWAFVPAEQQDSRAWLLSFEFSRDGTTVHSAPRS